MHCAPLKRNHPEWNQRATAANVAQNVSKYSILKLILYFIHILYFFYFIHTIALQNKNLVFFPDHPFEWSPIDSFYLHSTSIGKGKILIKTILWLNFSILFFPHRLGKTLVKLYSVGYWLKLTKQPFGCSNFCKKGSRLDLFIILIRLSYYA